jgi:predicted GH43/DUF377 family glycosyl hydrolase
LLRPDPAFAWRAGSVQLPSVVRSPWLRRIILCFRGTNDIYYDQHGRYVSSLGWGVSKDGVAFKVAPQPYAKPDRPEEQGLGTEDGRPARIYRKWWDYLIPLYGVFYTASYWQKGTPFEEKRDRLAFLTFRWWFGPRAVRKHGVVGPDFQCKAGAFFPRRLPGKGLTEGRLCQPLLWTAGSDSDMSRIMIAYPRALDPHEIRRAIQESWDEGFTVLEAPPGNWRRGPEVGAPPIWTRDGWLMIYCRHDEHPEREWAIGAALLDRRDPRIVVADMPYPILRPETDDELNGVATNICMVGGALIRRGLLLVYYTGGDMVIKLAVGRARSLIQALKEDGVRTRYDKVA